MLWNGHRGYASVLMKLARDLGLISKEEFAKAFADAVRYSVYPDAIFQDKLRAKYFPELKDLKCPWKSCELSWPCVPSPDYHHVRWCGKETVTKLWEEFDRTRDWKTFGVLTHFMADLVCEPYEGVFNKVPKEQWDYRDKAVPLSNAMEQLSLKYSGSNPLVKEAVELAKSVRGRWLVVVPRRGLFGIVLTKDDAVALLGYKGRELVQKRKYE